MSSTEVIEKIFRNERRGIVATLIRVCGGDFEMAEDVVQESFEKALARWPDEGIPPNPAGWITVTARRRAIDRLRRIRNLDEKEDVWARLLGLARVVDDYVDPRPFLRRASYRVFPLQLQARSRVAALSHQVHAEVCASVLLVCQSRDL